MAPINLINLINLRLLVYLHQVHGLAIVRDLVGRCIRACTEYPIRIPKTKASGTKRLSIFVLDIGVHAYESTEHVQPNNTE